MSDETTAQPDETPLASVSITITYDVDTGNIKIDHPLNEVICLGLMAKAEEYIKGYFKQMALQAAMQNQRRVTPGKLFGSGPFRRNLG